jgi:hypothetical protein
MDAARQILPVAQTLYNRCSIISMTYPFVKTRRNLFSLKSCIIVSQDRKNIEDTTARKRPEKGCHLGILAEGCITALFKVRGRSFVTSL